MQFSRDNETRADFDDRRKISKEEYAVLGNAASVSIFICMGK